MNAGNPLMRIWHGWSDFWFRPSDPTPLGIIRLLTGAITFYVILAYSVDLQELLGKNAWLDHATMERFRREVPALARPLTWDDTPRVDYDLNRDELEYANYWKTNPRAALVTGQPVYSIWFHVTDPMWMNITHVCILFTIFLFTIGFATRVTAVLTWFAVLSYTNRAATTVFGMDTMMNILLIYSMIGPMGAALSVDRLIRRYWITWRTLRAGRPAPDTIPHSPMVSANLTIRLIQVHLCIIYLASGLAKRGNAWWTGTAVWGTLANPEFSPMHLPAYLGFLQFLSHHRWLWEISMNFAALFTLAMEIGFPFLVWIRPLRWIMISMALMLHAGIAVFMGLNTFSLFMVTMLVAFVPLEVVLWLVRLPGRNAARLRLEFNDRDRSQARTASIVRAVDVWDQVELNSNNGDVTAQPRVTTEEDEVASGFYLWHRLATKLRLLYPLAPLTSFLNITGIGKAVFGGYGEPSPSLTHTRNGIHRANGEKVAR
jgi:hypothetical protein